jgi:hypothetical protein
MLDRAAVNSEIALCIGVAGSMFRAFIPLRWRQILKRKINPNAYRIDREQAFYVRCPAC